MMSEEDLRALRFARLEFTRRCIDVTSADIRMHHGVLHIRGIVRRAAGARYSDLQAELEHVVHALRSKAEFRDISLEVTYQSGGGR